MRINVSLIGDDHVLRSTLAKLADVDIEFDEGLMSGLRLEGFSVWSFKAGAPRVVFPTRDRGPTNWRIALLQPVSQNSTGRRELEAAILREYFRATTFALQK